LRLKPRQGQPFSQVSFADLHLHLITTVASDNILDHHYSVRPSLNFCKLKEAVCL
jgi:hypothetical protein